MNAPDNRLPFFDYGLLMPGQMGFQRIRRFVLPYEAVQAKIRGRLFIRDGLPILSLGEEGTVTGYLIRFDERAADPYGQIYQEEQDYQYY